MSLVQNIDGIPAYTTTAEALAWASQYGITNYHTHVIAGEIAYMGGSSHDEITSAIRSGAGPTSGSSNSASGGY